MSEPTINELKNELHNANARRMQAEDAAVKSSWLYNRYRSECDRLRKIIEIQRDLFALSSADLPSRSSDNKKLEHDVEEFLANLEKEQKQQKKPYPLRRR